MNVQQIEIALYEFEHGKYGEIGWSAWIYESLPGAVDIPGVGSVEMVERVGGSEGSGEHTHLVFKISGPGGVHYYQKTGYYASFSGTYWDGDLFEVAPVQKTITVYKEVKGK